MIGGGVSGLTAGYVLSRTAEVTLFEAAARLGGHANTRLVPGEDGHLLGVDTGFTVYNERTYPHLTRLFHELGVTTQPSDMSMSVRCAGCGLNYAGKRGLSGLAAGLNRGGERYLGMLAQVPRFHREARRLLMNGASGDLRLGEFLADGGYSDYFRAHFAIPLAAAVWSCPPGIALDYPAAYLFRFLDNHGMLSASGALPWRTVTGGSRRYVARVAGRLAAVRLTAPVRTIRRHTDGVEVVDESGQTANFDAAVIATHPDQALRLLSDPTQAEQDVLGAFSYTRTRAVLHTDSRLLPAHRRVRASWNYQLSGCDTRKAAGISYHMNRLQHLPDGRDYIVTLGGNGAVSPERVIGRMEYSHPVCTPKSLSAQQRLPELNTGVSAFAGAYHGWGFHEDGCRSGVQAAQALGVSW